MFILENNDLKIVKPTSNMEGYLEVIKHGSFVVRKALLQREGIYVPNKEEVEVRLLNNFIESAVAIPFLGKEEMLGCLLI